MAYRNDLALLDKQATYNNDLMSLVFKNMTDEELKIQYPPQPVHPNAIDITGQKFGKLTALWKVGNQHLGHTSKPIYAFRCDCGNIKFSTSYLARSGQLTTCGCGLKKRGEEKQGKGKRKTYSVNQKIGRLLIIEKLPSKNNKAQWKCLCDCGNICIRATNDFTKGSVSCGVCIQYDSIRNKLIEQNDTRNASLLLKPINTLIGLYFGKLLIVEDTKKSKNTYKVFKAKCECGNTCEITLPELRHGKTSCGCDTLQKKREAFSSIKPGDKFGKLTALECINKSNDTHLYWICKCDCGNMTEPIRSTCLISGETMSCGCLNSKGEEKITKILNDNHIKFNKQYTYNDLLSPKGYPLKYDFLVDNRFLLEFDGIQHYEEWSRSAATLQERQLYDKIKNEYAKSHNIPLKRIPYWDLNKITLENIMDDTYLII